MAIVINTRILRGKRKKFLFNHKFSHPNNRSQCKRSIYNNSNNNSRNIKIIKRKYEENG